MTLNKIKQDLRTYVKSVMGTTMVTALISGVIVHLFGLVNVLHNYDDIAVSPEATERALHPVAGSFRF